MLPPETAMNRQSHVLLIEDEADIAEMVAFALARAGIASSHAASGGDGLAKLSEGADAVILDVGLPDQDGFEVLKQIRRHSEVPVLMLTAQNEEIDRVLGLELGADDYVGKPFSPRELVARVKTILKRSRRLPENPPPTANHGFAFDHERCTACYRGQNLPLTLAEWRLLHHLAKQPGRVFSRRQLLDAVFSERHPSDERSIDTHIKALRMKIKHIDPQAEPIATHRLLGYSFEPQA